MNIRKITISEIEFLAHELAKTMMTWNEPIPSFGTRFPNVLESCIATPFTTFSRRVLYKGLLGKAAVLFYVMIKNHPFQNGNKRIAITTMLVFLLINKKWLKVDNQVLYNFAKWVAESNSQLKDETVKAIEKFLSLNMVDFV